MSYKISEFEGRWYVAYVDKMGEYWTMTPDGLDSEEAADEFVEQVRAEARRAVSTYRIQDTSGRYWTGECFGVEQAAQKYTFDELPDMLDDLVRVMYAAPDCDGSCDIRYYSPDEDYDALASVV